LSTCDKHGAEKSHLEQIQALYTGFAETPIKTSDGGRENARSLGHADDWLRRIPDVVWESAAAVGNPFSVSPIQKGQTIVDLSEPHYVFVNTLFALSEGCLYAQLVDKEKEAEKKKDKDKDGDKGKGKEAGKKDDAKTEVKLPDPVTLELVWSYSSPRFFSTNISSAQRLPNGNTLVTEGAGGRLFEVTTEGAVVWEYMNPLFAGPRSSNDVYRGYRLPYGWLPQLSRPREKAVTPPALGDFALP